ncbi:MAG: GIY-YIG nuclease family protein [Verrucomicrobia bacterium]|nr:MAG: GIY-YIG nuclease family protein [Verrucomicrobiota bacterium]
MPFIYVYILNDRTGRHHYVGVTDDLKDRLGRHNRGEVIHTSKHRPWKMQSVVAFDSLQKATAFERYLKSHAGREWAKRHL